MTKLFYNSSTASYLCLFANRLTRSYSENVPMTKRRPTMLLPLPLNLTVVSTLITPLVRVYL